MNLYNFSDRQLLATAHGAQAHMTVALRDRLSDRTHQLEMIERNARATLAVLLSDRKDVEKIRAEVASELRVIIGLCGRTI